MYFGREWYQAYNQDKQHPIGRSFQGGFLDNICRASANAEPLRPWENLGDFSFKAAIFSRNKHNNSRRQKVNQLSVYFPDHPQQKKNASMSWHRKPFPGTQSQGHQEKTRRISHSPVSRVACVRPPCPWRKISEVSTRCALACALHGCTVCTALVTGRGIGFPSY